MTTRSWLDDERRLSDSVRQAASLFVAGTKYPARLLTWGALFAAVLLGAIFLGRRSYTPRYVLRVLETERDPTNLPRPKRDLADYVRQGVFTSAPLLELIARYHLYPGLSRKSPRAALDAFREDIDVDVYKNYFVEERSANSAPRSARLSIGYKNSDPDVAVLVTRDLGSLVVEHELAARRDQAARAAAAARRELDEREQVLDSLRLEIASKRTEIDRTDGRDPEPRVELTDLVASLNALSLEQQEAEQREASLAVGAALESRGLGMSFEVVNDASLPSRSERVETEFILAGASLVLGLPLVVMAVGAFSAKGAFA